MFSRATAVSPATGSVSLSVEYAADHPQSPRYSPVVEQPVRSSQARRVSLRKQRQLTPDQRPVEATLIGSAGGRGRCCPSWARPRSRSMRSTARVPAQANKIIIFSSIQGSGRLLLADIVALLRQLCECVTPAGDVALRGDSDAAEARAAEAAEEEARDAWEHAVEEAYEREAVEHEGFRPRRQ